MEKIHEPVTRHEPLQPSPIHTFTLNRRQFVSLLGTGLTVAITFPSATAWGLATADDAQVSAWIHIGADNRVTVYTGKVEVGQNIRTSLAQLVAEELEVDVRAIDMIMGDTDQVPYDRGTFGSLSTPVMGTQLRKAAATARESLLRMAAAAWKTERKSVTVSMGTVSAKGKTITYGELVKGKKLEAAIDDTIALKSPADWKVAGKTVLRTNGTAFVTGKHIYTSDLKLSGMLYGKVLRPPAYGAELESLDASRASSVAGVTVVHDGSFAGVAAPDPFTAERALALLDAKWKLSAQPSRHEIFDYLVKNSQSARQPDSTGDATGAYTNAQVKIDQSFHVDYIAHAPLEPRAAVADWKPDRLTVWTGTQRPFGVQEELMRAFHLPKEKVRVIMPDTGSGYGGKHSGDAALEAARLSKATGKPVKLVWTREEEFIWAYFRPAGVITVKAGCDASGKVLSWELHNYNSGGSGLRTPYEVPNQKSAFHPVDSPLRQGSYRGLAATANIFAIESTMDDLAALAKKDPLEFRLNHLSNERLRNVLIAATDRFGWKGLQRVAHHGYGLACGEEKRSVVACCAEVVHDPSEGSIRVVRIVIAFECGAIVNPGNCENQVLGSVVQGIGGALFEAIDFKDGKILNPTFSSYRVPRFSDMPLIDVVLVNKLDLKKELDVDSVGAGETPIFGVAPAIRNAIADACGKRLTQLPMLPGGVV